MATSGAPASGSARTGPENESVVGCRAVRRPAPWAHQVAQWVAARPRQCLPKIPLSGVLEDSRERFPLPACGIRGLDLEAGLSSSLVEVVDLESSSRGAERVSIDQRVLEKERVPKLGTSKVVRAEETTAKSPAVMPSPVANPKHFAGYGADAWDDGERRPARLHARRPGR